MTWTEYGGYLDMMDYDFYNRYHRRASFVNVARLRGFEAEIWWLAAEWRWSRCDSEIEAELEKIEVANSFSLPSFLNAEAIAKHLVVLFSIPCDPGSCLQRLLCDFPSLSRFVGLVEERLPGTWPDYSTFMLALPPEDRPPPPPQSQGSVLVGPVEKRRPEWWELWGWSWGGRKRPVQFGGPGKAPPAIYAICFGMASGLSFAVALACGLGPGSPPVRRSSRCCRGVGATLAGSAFLSPRYVAPSV
ncbi:Acadl [Symbiodinium sp. CCMP2592]|nr:Acadl [Symbiodinium sp. CCMP2592]